MTPPPSLFPLPEAIAAEAQLIVNARVNMDPDRLRSVVESCLAVKGDVRAEIGTIQNFSPSPPKPVYRYEKVV